METSKAIGNGYDAAWVALWGCSIGGGGGWLGCKLYRSLQSSQKGIIGKAKLPLKQLNRDRIAPSEHR